jgi:hypothetical protein
MRRARVATLAIVTAVLAGCGSDQGALDWLSVTLSVSDASPALGESTTLQLSATNNALIPQVLTFTSSQRYDFTVRDADGQVLWQWSCGRQFLQALSRETMDRGETWTFTATWDLRDNAGNALPPGNYTAEGELVCLGEACSEPVELAIEPAE